MKCRIEKNWVGACWDIWFFEPDGSGTAVMEIDGSLIHWETIPLGAVMPEPTIRLHGEALEALLAEAQQIIPESSAGERHLKDAITVRDRLLKLIEDKA